MSSKFVNEGAFLLLGVGGGLVLGALFGGLALGFVVGAGVGFVSAGIAVQLLKRKAGLAMSMICFGVFVAVAALLYQAGSAAGERDRTAHANP